MTHAELIRLAEKFYKKSHSGAQCACAQTMQKNEYRRQGARELLTYLKSLPVDEGEPDGFVACAPNGDEMTYRNKYFGIQMMLMTRENADAQAFLSKEDIQAGWKIRPVRLQFLDTNKEKESK